MADWHNRLDTYYKLYRAEDDQGMYRIVTRARYVVPVIYKTVETILPRIISVLFSASPPVQAKWRIHPGDPNAGIQLRMVDQTFEYIFDKKKLFWIVQSWIKDSLIYGQSYLKVGWKHRTQEVEQTVRDIHPETGEIVDRKETREETVVDELDVQNVDPRELLFAPEAKFPDPFGSAKYVIHHTQRRKSQVIAMRDAGIYEDFRDDELARRADKETPAEKKSAAINRNIEAEQDPDDPMIDIYEYWEDDRVITTANHKVLLRDEQNPFRLPGQAPKKPFVACCDNMVPNELFQIGEAEPLHHIQIENSTLRRQRTDNNSIIINKTGIYDKNADVDLESLQLFRPGGWTGAAPQDGDVRKCVVPFPSQEINGASYRETDQLDKDAQDTSGLLDYAVGSAPERRETATTVQLLQTAANQRFDLKIRNYNASFVELAEMIYERLKKFQTKPLPLRIPIPGQLGVQFVNVTRDLLPPLEQIDLTAPGSPALLLKDARRQTMLQYVEMLKTMPTADPMAAHKLMIQTLKESEIDGIEPILQILENVMPPMMSPQGGNGAKPPQPPQVPGFQGVNEAPMIPQFPRPER